LRSHAGELLLTVALKIAVLLDAEECEREWCGDQRSACGREGIDSDGWAREFAPATHSSFTGWLIKVRFSVKLYNLKNG